MAQKRKTVGRSWRAKGRGTVHVEEDDKGYLWVTCTGCRLCEKSSRALALSRARKHADSCIR